MCGRYSIHDTIEDYIHPEVIPGPASCHTRPCAMPSRPCVMSYSALPQVAWGLPLNETTLPTLLKRQGYATHAVGKWHLGYFKWDYTPTFRGFDSFLGYYEGAEDYFDHTRGGSYDLHREEGARCGPNCSTSPDVQGAYSVGLFSAEAVRRIQQHGEDKLPWFIYLAYQRCHSPHLESPAPCCSRCC